MQRMHRCLRHEQALNRFFQKVAVTLNAWCLPNSNNTSGEQRRRPIITEKGFEEAFFSIYGGTRVAHSCCKTQVVSNRLGRRRLQRVLPRVQVTYLFVRFLQMLHQNGNHDVNQNELGHQDKNDEEQRREIRGHATISQTIVAVLAFFPQSVFHYAVPVVTGGYPE